MLFRSYAGIRPEMRPHTPAWSLRRHPAWTATPRTPIFIDAKLKTKKNAGVFTSAASGPKALEFEHSQNGGALVYFLTFFRRCFIKSGSVSR